MISMRFSEDKCELKTLQDKLKNKYESDSDKYCGWIYYWGQGVIPLMNPDYLTKNNLW